MKFKDTLSMSVTGLSTHKSRAALTILGIVIGIASITLVMSIGEGTQNLIVGEIQSLGTSNIYVLPGTPAGARTGGALLADSLTNKDLEDLQKKSNVPDATAVVPAVFGPLTASYESETYSGMVFGTTEEFFTTNDIKMEEGQGDRFTDEDVSSRNPVAVIGKRIAEKLFGASDPIGQKIKVKDQKLRVIGVLPSMGQRTFTNLDEVVLVPYTVAQQSILGIRYIQRITVQVDSVNNIPGAKKDVERLMRDNHNITDPSKDDFYVQTQEDLVGTISTITNILTILLTSVAAISLVVGGIGIMNIMLVSVTERTREIGLRKALGATNRNILIQFLTEAVILTISGGVIGILLGTLLSMGAAWAITQFASLNFAFIFPVTGALMGIIVSTIIGFVFGVFPARQASRKSPMEALRYE
jgi:putative ABC transport system permease protein